jgi:hypothetical protein
MDGVNMGLGIGLSGRLDAPGRVFAAQQQEQAYKRKANLQKQKEQDAEVDELVKGVLKERGKYHKLVSPEINREVGDTLKKMLELKINNPNNYVNDVYGLFYGDPNTNTPGLLSKASTALYRSEQLKKLGEVSENRKKGKFVSPSQDAAAKEISNHSDYTSWVNSLKEKGISDDYFTLNPDSGEFTMEEVPAVDFKKYTDDIVEKKKNLILNEVRSKTKVGNKDVEIIKTITGIPRTKKEAEDYRADYIKRNKTSRGAPEYYSGEDMAEALFSDAEAKRQYVAVHPETKGMDDEQLKTHYLDKYFEPAKPYKETPRSLSSGQDINITNQLGGENKGRDFYWSKEKGTVPGTAIEYSGSGYLNVNVTPKEGLTFILQGAVKSNDGSSYSPKKQASAKEVKLGTVYITRTATDNSGSKRLLPDGQKPKKGETVKYEMMVEATFSDLKFTKSTEELFKETILVTFDQANQLLSTQSKTDYTRESLVRTINEMDTYSKQLSNTPR